MTYSAIHKVARLYATGRNAAIHGQWTFFHSAGIVPGKSKEQPGTCEAGSFVNHAVMIAMSTN